MNKMTFGALSAVAQVERPTQRALAKQRTREKILASARTLFTERGYDGATVRDIASAAGMSTGAVFASFTDKSDLFIEIVGDQHDALVRAMRAAAACKKPRAAVEAVLDAAVDAHMSDLPLFQATMSALWSKDMGPLVRSRLRRTPARDILAAVVKAAIACGDLASVSDPDLLAQMIWDGYISALRRAALEGLGTEAVRRLVRDQARVILAGATELT